MIAVFSREFALKALNIVLEADVIHFHAQTLAAVQAQLSAEGSQWSLEEAVRQVLEG